jgi:UDP-N-acetylmuramate dehydrogenase
MTVTEPSTPLAAVTVEAAAALLGDRVQRNVEFGARTTYRVGGTAALGLEITALDDLALVHQVVERTGIEVIVLGKGSNVLVADSGFAGLLIWLGEWSSKMVVDDHSVVAGASVALPVLARRTVAAGLTGLEWAVGVPGSVGGAVRMNAGGHGSDMASSLAKVHVFRLDTGEDVQMGVSELGLGFRHSELRDVDVVVDASFQLTPGDQARSEEELAEIVRWRRQHQPGGQNAGSVFVNPQPMTSGELIESSGLRGFRLGSATVSDKHANFIQSDEGGSADDVRALMTLVRDRVHADSGIALRSEIRLVGFDGPALDRVPRESDS